MQQNARKSKYKQELKMQQNATNNKKQELRCNKKKLEARTKEVIRNKKQKLRSKKRKLQTRSKN